MTDLTVVENKISSVKKYLKILERYKKYSLQEIEADLDLKGAVERYLYLAVQATIDVAEATIAYKNLRKPATMGEAFQILSEEGLIPNDLAEKMVKMTGFRNIIVHDYEKINYDILYEVLQKGLKDIEKLLLAIKKI